MYTMVVCVRDRDVRVSCMACGEREQERKDELVGKQNRENRQQTANSATSLIHHSISISALLDLLSGQIWLWPT